MPQLHHRDPSIIGLLGASPHLTPLQPGTPVSSTPPTFNENHGAVTPTPPKQLFDVAALKLNGPSLPAGRAPVESALTALDLNMSIKSRFEFYLNKGRAADTFERPFYEMIVDGIHSHPNSVKVGLRSVISCWILKWRHCPVQLAYSTYPEGCILVTDGRSMHI
jgi:N-acetylglucosamine-6-phosphate deacetylase